MMKPWDVILPGVGLLGVVIFVHELGHFLMAKWRGVRVLKFSLGFGPRLIGFTRGETEYALSWIPLGGYVQMAGDTPDTQGHMPGSREEFLSHPWFGRILIAVAGPAANLVTAFLLLVLVALVGVSYPDYPNVLGSVADTSFAARVLPLREGDRIVAVGGRPTTTWDAIFDRNSSIDAKQAVTVTAERDGAPFSATVPPEAREPFFSSLRRPPDLPLIGAVATGMPAYKAGLKERDRIVAVDGHPITAWSELPGAFRGRVDQRVVLTVERDGRRFDVAVTPIAGEAGPQNGMIGIEPPRGAVYVKRYPLTQALPNGALSTLELVRSVYSGMWRTITRPLYYREYVGGPIFIVQAAAEAAKHGLDWYLGFMAMINVAIMAFNLLPLPILDGGHIVLALVEALRRQAISARAYVRFQKVGLAVLGTLLVLILANDPLRVVKRQRAIEQQAAPHPAAPATTPATP